MLEKLKEYAELIFDNIQDGVLVIDRDYKIISANKASEKWAKKSLLDILDHSCIEIFHDNDYVCPHCVAKVTFETGDVNVAAQRFQANGEEPSYAEISSYPIKHGDGEISECIVFIRDVTERMLCHEEILSLYNEVIQTKEYLEGVIENSADAIITTDLNGIVSSWNKGAENIYGFTKDEVIGKFLPFVVEGLIDPEWENNKRIREGEVIKRVEAIRKRKDGQIITVSLTLSPIKNTDGEVIGISGISRDITEIKRVERELRRKNQELERLFFISSAMRGTLELDRLLRMILTAVTMGDGLGFNRAILFFYDDINNILEGVMGVGPISHSEAYQIWAKLSMEKKTLTDIMREIDAGQSLQDSHFDSIVKKLKVPLDKDTILTKTVKEKRPFNVVNSYSEPLSDSVFSEQIKADAYATVPLISRDKVVGVLWVDNYFNKKPIVDEDMRFLIAFSNHVSSAIENARLYEKVQVAEKELENIFKSITDMVYIISDDYVIKDVNPAVCKRIGRSREEIIGKKCYEVIHGTSVPDINCPHQITMQSKVSHVKEIEDSFLGGSFIISSSPIFDFTGRFVGTVNVMRDVTELNELRERLVKIEKMAALGEVAARVAHEIRNPLVSLGGFARRLEKKLDGSLKDYAKIISDEVGRLESILNDILGFVKEIRLFKERIQTKELLEDIISTVESELEGRDIMIKREYLELPEIYVDANRLREAIVNIIRNAIQSIDGNGTVTIRTYIRNEMFLLEVEDTGKGICEKDLPHIFDPFYTTKKEGTGLGLTISNKIIEEHGGNIEVESVEGKGSIFRITIPINIFNREAKNENSGS
jgi:PAS domain S-box-containing protein